MKFIAIKFSARAAGMAWRLVGVTLQSCFREVHAVGSFRGNRLYSGKAKMVHERERASRASHQEEINGYFERAARRPTNRPPLKVVVRGPAPPRPVEAQGRPAASSAAAAPTRGPKEPAPDRPWVTQPDQPVRILRPLPMMDGCRFDRRFSYGRLACGFVLGTAAALAVLLLVDLAFL